MFGPVSIFCVFHASTCISSESDDVVNVPAVWSYQSIYVKANGHDCKSINGRGNG